MLVWAAVPTLNTNTSSCLRAIERPHAAVGLVPDAQVLELGEDRLAGLEQLAHVTPVHADEGDRAVARERCGMPERLLQEAGERFDGHLARRPWRTRGGGFVPSPADMAVDRDVVGRVGEHEVRPLVPHQEVEVALGLRASPQISRCRPRQPDIAWPGDRGCRTVYGKGTSILGLGGTVRRALARLVEHEVDLGQREAGELDVEIDVDAAPAARSPASQVPAGVEGQLVVGQHVGAPFGRGQVGQAHVGHASRPSSLAASTRPWPAMISPSSRSGPDW